MPVLKNPRHERFVLECFINGGNLTQAYLAANPSVNKHAARINSRNLWQRDRNVIARVQELRQKMARRTEITVEKILGDYQEALDLAKHQEKPNEIVNAATAQAKLVGLLRDKTEIGRVGDFDNVDSIGDIIASVAREAGQDAADALAKALGADKPNEIALSEIDMTTVN